MRKSSVSEYIRNLKITTKILVIYVIMVLLFIGSTVVYYLGSHRALQRESQELSDLLIMQKKEAIEASLNNTTKNIFDNYNLQLLASCLLEQDTTRSYAYSLSVQNALIKFLSLENNVNWVVVADENNQFFSNSRSGKAIDYAYRDNLEQDKQKSIEYAARFVWRKLDDGTINISRMLYALPSMKYTGYVIINVDTNQFANYLSDTHFFNVGSIVYDSYDRPMLFDVDDNMKPLLEKELDFQTSFSVPFHQYSLAWKRVTNSNLSFCQIVDLGYTPQQIRSLAVTFISFCLIILALASALIFTIFRQIKQNISVVQKGIGAISAGNLDLRIVPVAMDEFGIIGMSINDMTKDIKNLMWQVEEETIRRKQAEYNQLELQFSALQSQINPHFLFNALESISGLSKLHNDMQSSHAAQALARLLRLNLERTGSICPLSDEIEYIELYLQVYETIYPGLIQSRIEHDSDLGDIAVPVFLLQPIVENSIVHGVSKKPGGGRVTIETYIEDARLVIHVADDGCGMSEEQLSLLLNGGKNGKKDAHIGLKNVQERIHFLFGNDYGLEFFSKPDVGTVCKISLPL